ncbi:MAG TPA: HIT domain-containing protein [bacterium]
MERMWAPWRVKYIRKTGGDCFLCEALEKKDPAQCLIIEKGALAFSIMNRFPYNNGHILVAPLRHVASLELLNDGEVLEINRLLSRLIKSINHTMKPHGYNIGINQGQTAGAGLVTHVHFHCVPRWQGDTNFMPVLGDTKVISEGLASTYKTIKEGLVKLNQL